MPTGFIELYKSFRCILDCDFSFTKRYLFKKLHASRVFFKWFSATEYLPEDYTKRVNVGRLLQFIVFIKFLIPTTLRVKITNGTHDAVLVRSRQTNFFSRSEIGDFGDSLTNQDVSGMLESIEKINVSWS